MKKLNKIIVKQNVLFCLKAWAHQNKIMHDTSKCKEYVIELHKKIIEKIKNKNKPSVRRCVRTQKIDVDKCDTSCVKLWNESRMKIFKQAKSESENDNRNYFAMK